MCEREQHIRGLMLFLFRPFSGRNELLKNGYEAGERCFIAAIFSTLMDRRRQLIGMTRVLNVNNRRPSTYTIFQIGFPITTTTTTTTTVG